MIEEIEIVKEISTIDLLKWSFWMWFEGFSVWIILGLIMTSVVELNVLKPIIDPVLWNSITPNGNYFYDASIGTAALIAYPIVFGLGFIFIFVRARIHIDLQIKNKKPFFSTYGL